MVKKFPRLCTFILLVYVFSQTTAEIKSKYPLDPYHQYRDKVTKKYGAIPPSRVEGVWSQWSPWSPCSRTCGGGVTIQTRECINRPADPRLQRGRRRKRLDSNEVENHCVGLYKRYHLCNTQPCSLGRDFLAEQCAVFNTSPFRGRIYFWEPYTKAGECVLNCRAVGMGFYAQLNRTVWDGTPCTTPTTQNMQVAPAGTKGVCVHGVCKSVSSEGVIGAISPPRGPELCSECSGGCKSESLFFLKPILPSGYSFVDTIPKGACTISISQLKHTRNYIALRHPNGTYFLNGPNEVSRRTEVYFAGTLFNYKRQDGSNLEAVSSKGPLQHSVDIMILYNQPNPGIKYEYMIPADQAALPSVLESRRKMEPPVEARRLDRPFVSMNQQNDETRPIHRRRRKKFVWKIVGMTQCSKSCGGGTKHPIVACRREQSQQAVSERRCAGMDRPYNHTMRCNTQPCSNLKQNAQWGGTWSACSTSCGPGEQTRAPVCMQQIGPNLNTQVHPSACSNTAPVTTQRCEIAPCDPRDNELEVKFRDQEPTAAQWHTGGWSQCSTTCGSGMRTRSVTCSGQCRQEDKPRTTETCLGSPCSESSVSTSVSQARHHHSHTHTPSSVTASTPNRDRSHSQNSAIIAQSSWLVTDWSESCSEECGTGSQARWVACPGGECDHESKPDTQRACSSDKHCGGKWYTGPWGPCSDSCGGPARQRREVLCIVHIRGQIRVVSDMTCPHNDKPYSEQACEGHCRPKWHMGEWGLCEACAGNQGTQRREVRCLDYNARPASGCPFEMPTIKRTCQCSDHRFREISQAHDEPALDGECVNTVANCHIVIQGRMCRVPTYYKQCCASCRRAHQSPRD